MSRGGGGGGSLASEFADSKNGGVDSSGLAAHQVGLIAVVKSVGLTIFRRAVLGVHSVLQQATWKGRVPFGLPTCLRKLQVERRSRCARDLLFAPKKELLPKCCPSGNVDPIGLLLRPERTTQNRPGF